MRLVVRRLLANARTIPAGGIERPSEPGPLRAAAPDFGRGGCTQDRRPLQAPGVHHHRALSWQAFRRGHARCGAQAGRPLRGAVLSRPLVRVEGQHRGGGGGAQGGGRDLRQGLHRVQGRCCRAETTEAVAAGGAVTVRAIGHLSTEGAPVTSKTSWRQQTCWRARSSCDA